MSTWTSAMILTFYLNPEVRLSCGKC